MWLCGDVELLAYDLHHILREHVPDARGMLARGKSKGCVTFVLHTMCGILVVAFDGETMAGRRDGMFVRSLVRPFYLIGKSLSQANARTVCSI